MDFLTFLRVHALVHHRARGHRAPVIAAATMSKRPSKRARTEPGAAPSSPTAILLGGTPLPVAMVSQYRCGQFCDVTVVVEDERFLVQRSVLAGGSEYFRGLLLGGGSHMADGGASAPILTLEEMRASTVRLSSQPRLSPSLTPQFSAPTSAPASPQPCLCLCLTSSLILIRCVSCWSGFTRASASSSTRRCSTYSQPPGGCESSPCRRRPPGRSSELS